MASGIVAVKLAWADNSTGSLDETGQILSASDSAISAAGRAGLGSYVASGSVSEIEIDDIAFGGFSVSVATPRGLTRAIERGIGRA